MQGCLVHQFQFDFACAVQFVEHPRVRLTWERTDDFFHSARFEQLGQTVVAIACIVADNGQVFDAQIQQAINEFGRLSCGQSHQS
jgi:hypothetical protein